MEVSAELKWIEERIARLVYRGMSAVKAREQAVEEQARMEELGLDDPNDKRS